MAAKDKIFGSLFQLKVANQNKVGLDAGASLQVPSARFYLEDATDNTKLVNFATSGVTTATTRTVTFPDRDLALGGGIGTKITNLSATGGLTLTVLQSGAMVNFDAAGATAVALPAVGATDVGVYYDFYWSVTATGNHTITAQAADLLLGYAAMGVSGAGDVDTYFPNGSSHLVLTANGSTTGGLKGSYARYVCTSATTWNVTAVLVCTGTQATPFS